MNKSLQLGNVTPWNKQIFCISISFQVTIWNWSVKCLVMNVKWGWSRPLPAGNAMDTWGTRSILQWRHMSTMASQITSLTIVYSTVCSFTDQKKHQSSASLAFVRGIHRWPVNSPHKGTVTRKMFPFDDVIMKNRDHPRQWFGQQGHIASF